jgi:hypothetical protein
MVDREAVPAEVRLEHGAQHDRPRDGLERAEGERARVGARAGALRAALPVRELERLADGDEGEVGAPRGATMDGEAAVQVPELAHRRGAVHGDEPAGEGADRRLERHEEGQRQEEGGREEDAGEAQAALRPQRPPARDDDEQVRGERGGDADREAHRGSRRR